MDWMGDERVSGQRTYTSHCGAPHSYFHLSLLFHLVLFLLSLILVSATVLAVSVLLLSISIHPAFRPTLSSAFLNPLDTNRSFLPLFPAYDLSIPAIPFSSSSSCTCHSITAPQSTTPTMSFDSRRSTRPCPCPCPCRPTSCPTAPTLIRSLTLPHRHGGHLSL